MKKLFAPLMLFPLLAFALPARPVATYRVPVPKELAPYASFEIPYDSLQSSNGKLRLSYSLPAALVGETEDYEFEGQVDRSEPDFQLKGPKGEMSCARDSGGATCQVTHHNVHVDLAKVEAALDASNLTPEQKAGHLKVSQLVARFGGDLVGVLEELPLYDQGN